MVKFPQNYQEQLRSHFGEEPVSDFMAGIRTTELPHQRGREASYVRTGRGTASERPVLYIPGFSETLVAKAPFIIEMSSRGFDIIAPDRAGGRVRKGKQSKHRDATMTRALDTLAVIEAESLQNTPINVVSHSMGALVLAEMVRLSERSVKSKTWYQDSRVAMLAPSSSYQDESFHSVIWRTFAKMMPSEKGTPKEIHDETKAMLKAGQKSVAGSLIRSLREGWELSKYTVEYSTLAPKVGNVSVFCYAKDVLFGDEQLSQVMDYAMENGVTYASPYSLIQDGTTPEGRPILRGLNGATHNDEQFTPSRVGGAVAEFLTAA